MDLFSGFPSLWWLVKIMCLPPGVTLFRLNSLLSVQDAQLFFVSMSMSPKNCWVDQAMSEIFDWTQTPSYHLHESSHSKSWLCSVSGLSTFNTFWFKTTGLWSSRISWDDFLRAWGKRSKRNNQMRKIYGIQARETGIVQILNC